VEQALDDRVVTPAYARCMKHLLVVALLGFVAIGCKQEVAARINCKVIDGPAAECTVTQTKGNAEFEACWDFKVTCENNATLEAAKTCAKVKDGGTTNTTIPSDKIKISGPCDAVKTAVVDNMTINGEASK
jgi:hypothetical protein